MNKIIYVWLMLLSLLLASCGNDVVKNDLWKNQKVNKQKVQQNIKQKKQVNNVKWNIENDNLSKLNRIENQEVKNQEVENQEVKNQEEILEQKDTKIIEKIDQTIKDIGWYKLDCKKKFKTQNWQLQCQEKQLLEAWTMCFDKKLWITLNNIDNYFTKQRFDLLVKEEIKQYKNICIAKLKEMTKQEEKDRIINQKMEKANKELDKIQKTFKLSDCEKYFKKWEKEDIIDLIKQCKLQYAIQIKNNCEILPKDLQKECKQTQKDIEIFGRMKTNYRLYVENNLFDKITNMIYKKYWLNEEGSSSIPWLHSGGF